MRDPKPRDEKTPLTSRAEEDAPGARSSLSDTLENRLARALADYRAKEAALARRAGWLRWRFRVAVLMAAAAGFLVAAAIYKRERPVAPDMGRAPAEAANPATLLPSVEKRAWRPVAEFDFSMLDWVDLADVLVQKLEALNSWAPGTEKFGPLARDARWFAQSLVEAIPVEVPLHVLWLGEPAESPPKP